MNVKPHKQSMSELKLRRLTEHNQRLKEDLDRPRIRVSEASQRYVYPSRPVAAAAAVVIVHHIQPLPSDQCVLPSSSESLSYSLPSSFS